MEKQNPVNRLKKLRSNYRFVIMNDDTFEEVAKFRITRLSVYIGISSLFILLVVLTATFIAFTPLKYYLPDVGYGNVKQLKAFKSLKLKTDSMETTLRQQQLYYDQLHKTLSGQVTPSDTTTLNLDVPKNEITIDSAKNTAPKKMKQKKRKKNVR